jgi:hypothetical protein
VIEVSQIEDARIQSDHFYEQHSGTNTIGNPTVAILDVNVAESVMNGSIISGIIVMQNRIRVDLRILGEDVDPKNLTEFLGVQPARTWLKGELVSPRSGIKFKENGWELSSGQDQHLDFEFHIRALLHKIEPNVDRFIQMCSQYHVELSCAIYIYYNNEESTPWIHFDRTAMNIFNQIGAEIDFDLYVLPGDPS